jgi:hypothetical protein
MSTNKGMLNKLYSETQGSHYNSKLVLHSSPSVPGRLIRYHVFMDHLYSKVPSNSYLHPFPTPFSTLLPGYVVGISNLTCPNF